LPRVHCKRLIIQGFSFLQASCLMMFQAPGQKISYQLPSPRLSPRHISGRMDSARCEAPGHPVTH
jgi:hypothetical protein